MTAHPHRGHESFASHLAHPLDHAPELLLALAAVIVVVAGPLAHAVAPASAMVAAASAALLAGGIALAVLAAVRLLRT